jgi:acyl-CoA synthetase (NDP forming)
MRTDQIETEPMQNEVHDEKSARAALKQSRIDIERFFAPKKAVAIAGSVDVSPGALNYLKRLGDDVKVCYINPKGVGGTDQVKVYKNALELPDGVDLVVVKVGPATVPQLVEDCAKRGIKNIIVFSSGFAEVGPEGVELEKKVAATARQYGVRIIGPNTNDNTFEKFAIPENHRGGLIALITQSGYNGRPIVEGINMGVGFRRWVTAGNEVDLGSPTSSNISRMTTRPR